jgi:hypothetical protein
MPIPTPTFPSLAEAVKVAAVEDVLEGRTRSVGDMRAARSKALIEYLSQGVDPITGNTLPNDHVCNHPDVIRALVLAARVMEKEEVHEAHRAEMQKMAEMDRAMMMKISDLELLKMTSRFDGIMETKLAPTLLGQLKKKLGS